MRHAVEIRNLFRVYQTQDGDAAALQGLSLTVADGELLALLGPSGSGKSTLLRIIAGLDRPSAGHVRVFGREVGRLSRRQATEYRGEQLGYMEQHYWRSLDPALTARELVGLQLALAGAPKRERNLRADGLLERVGLADRGGARPGELSGGEQQRVALCAALARRPRLLLADEPTGELDAATAQSVIQLVSSLARREGCVTLLVTHDPAAASVADRTIHIRDGRVSDEGIDRGDGLEHRIVVGRGGWLRVPEEALQQAGIQSRARVGIEPGRVILEAAAHDDSEEAPQRSAGLGAARQRSGTAARLTAVTKAFASDGQAPTNVLEELDAVFEFGTVTAVTGPSGSGKTTLVHLLAGLTLPSAGQVDVLGTDISCLDRSARAEFRRQHIAYVGQQVGLVPFLSARENVELALALRRPHSNGAGPSASAALELVGLGDRIDQRVARLSAGERQRVAIARAVLTEAELLVADEPTARLDQANALAIGALFTSLAEETGMAVVCATHDALLAEQSAIQLDLARA